MTKVLVTGAAGQVGCRLVRQLLAKNYEVKCLILPDDPNLARLNNLDVEIMEGNLLNPDLSVKALTGVDAVIHTANFVGKPADMTEKEFFDNNVGTTFNLVRAASKLADKLQRLVYISSSSVYPNDTHILAAKYHPVDEDHPKRPQGVYALSKWIGDEIVRGHVNETGLQASIIRPSGIVSGDAVLKRWTVRFAATILQIGQNNPKSELYMGAGAEPWKELLAACKDENQPCAITDEKGRPWIYQLVDARDVAHGCICALEHPNAVGETFNVSAPEPISFLEAAEYLAEKTGQEVWPWKTTKRWVFDLDNRKAKRLIGYNPKWGIKAMIDSALAYQAGSYQSGCEVRG